jgi:2-dehydro-3-deoxygluconokinase
VDLVTLGETMVTFCPEQPGPLRHAERFLRGVGGAESNVAIGLCRLGHAAQWIGVVGDDPFGDLILATLRGEGVDVSAVRRHPGAPTGLLFKERRPGGDSAVYYHRAGSAGSRLGPADVPDLGRARLLHLTGITPALSDSCREAVRVAVGRARGAGALISFDPNYRARLWTPDAARAALLPILPACDVLLLSQGEGELLFGSPEPAAIAREARARGCRHVAVRCGGEGAWAFAAEGPGTWVPAHRVTPLEPTGAGDAFDAGFLAGLLEGRDDAECVRMGNVCGALATTALGDWEGVPDRATLARLLAGGAPPLR